MRFQFTVATAVLTLGFSAAHISIATAAPATERTIAAPTVCDGCFQAAQVAGEGKAKTPNPVSQAPAQDKGSDIGMDKIHDLGNPLTVYGHIGKGRGSTKTTAKNGKNKKTANTKIATAGSATKPASCTKQSGKAGTTTAPITPDIAWAPGELQQLYGMKWRARSYNPHYRDFVRKKVSEWLQHLRNPYVSDLKKRQLLRVMIDLTDPKKNAWNPKSMMQGPPYCGDWVRELNSQLNPETNKVDGVIETVDRVLSLDNSIKYHKVALESAEKNNNSKRAKALKEKLKKETRKRNRLYESIPPKFKDALPKTSNRMVAEH